MYTVYRQPHLLFSNGLYFLTPFTLILFLFSFRMRGFQTDLNLAMWPWPAFLPLSTSQVHCYHAWILSIFDTTTQCFLLASNSPSSKS